MDKLLSLLLLAITTSLLAQPPETKRLASLDDPAYEDYYKSLREMQYVAFADSMTYSDTGNVIEHCFFDEGYNDMICYDLWFFENDHYKSPLVAVHIGDICESENCSDYIEFYVFDFDSVNWMQVTGDVFSSKKLSKQMMQKKYFYYSKERNITYWNGFRFKYIAESDEMIATYTIKESIADPDNADKTIQKETAWMAFIEFKDGKWQVKAKAK